MSSFKAVTLADWRAQVEKELAGKPFDKALVSQTLEGLSIQPLYTEGPKLPRVLGGGAPFRICMRHGADATAEEIAEDLDGGADALWLSKEAANQLPTKIDPHILLLRAEGRRECTLNGETAWEIAVFGADDAIDEIAIALAATVERIAEKPQRLLVRLPVARDTFLELCKQRALRLALRKVLTALELPALPITIHAVASPQSISVRDPWVNMLRVTTALFAAVLGGADLVTPLPFDDALEKRSALGRRIARNTGHVLREESALGRVVDPGAGSYYLDSLTDTLARKAWQRFRELQELGGLEHAAQSGRLAGMFSETGRKRRDAIAKRKLPILGVSEFVNLDEVLPSAPRSSPANDDAQFEALRARADALPKEQTEVRLAVLGPYAESRARVGFATGFFAAGGLRARELNEGERAKSGSIVCVCGSDERYASDAVSTTRALREQGAKHVLLAGRPGALENDLRAAGVDGFLFLGADVIATLTPLLDSLAPRAEVTP